MSPLGNSYFANIATYVQNGIFFPTRYLGGKTHSLPEKIYKISKNVISKEKEAIVSTGYHYSMQLLDRQASVRYLPYAAIVAMSHNNDEKWLTRWNLKLISPKDLGIDLTQISGRLECHEKCFFDPQSSLKVLIIKSETNKVIIAFGAVESGGSELSTEKEKNAMHRYQISLVIQNLLGIKLDIFDQAQDIFEKIQSLSQFEGCSFALCGLCWGGSLAQYVGLKKSISAFCFNCFPLGVSAQNEIPRQCLQRADEFITHISAQSDFVSDLKGIGIFDRSLTMAGIKTPGNFGKRYAIPSAFNSFHGTHAYVMGSLMKHLNYHSKDKPDKLLNDDLQSSLLSVNHEQEIESIFSSFYILKDLESLKDEEDDYVFI